MRLGLILSLTRGVRFPTLLPRMKHHRLPLLACALLPFLAAPSASASGRRFGYTYPTLTAPVGEIELENWITSKARPGVLRTFDFRHELEFGLTKRTQLGVYLANWEHDARAHESRYANTAIEVIHNLTHPVTDPLGSALYAELAMGDRHTALEGKLLLEKRMGKWVVGWNGILESEWSGERFGDLQEATGELGQTVGLAYDLTDHLSLGAELVHKLPLGTWRTPADAEVYAGPCLTFRKGRFFVGATALFQTTDKPEQATVQLRTIVGVEF